MILAETLECTVPSPNAVKDAVIYCVTNPTNATDISTSIATWATAGFTFLLAVLAYYAWISSKRQLKHMIEESEAAEISARRDLDAAEERSRDAIAAASNLESRRDADSALFGYLSAHIDLFAASGDPERSLPTAQAELRKANLRFIMVYAFPGRSGEIINFDDLMMLIAERHREHLQMAPGAAGAFRLSSAIQDGFNVVNNGLRDLYQGHIEALPFRESLAEAYRSILGEVWDLLPKEYVVMAVGRNWIDEQPEMCLDEYR